MKRVLFLATGEDLVATRYAAALQADFVVQSQPVGWNILKDRNGQPRTVSNFGLILAIINLLKCL